MELGSNQSTHYDEQYPELGGGPGDTAVVATTVRWWRERTRDYSSCDPVSFSISMSVLVIPHLNAEEERISRW